MSYTIRLLPLPDCAGVLATVRRARVSTAMRLPRAERRHAWRRAMTVGCLESAARHGGRLA